MSAAKQPAQFADAVLTHVSIRFSWMDRLRLLVAGTMLVTVEVKTEHEVGLTYTTSRASVKPLRERLADRWRARNGPVGYEEVRTPAGL